MRRIMAAGVLAAVFAGCGDSTGPSGVIADALVGSWTAEPACLPTCGIVVVSLANAADSINMTTFGIVTRMTLASSGRVELASSVTGAPSVGTGRTEGAMLIVNDPAGPVDTMDYTVTGTRLELRFRRHFTVFDFTGDQQNDPARVIWRLQRQ